MAKQPTKCRDCNEFVPTGRVKLGWRTCLACGDREAEQKKWTIVSGHKSGFFIANREELKQLNPKRVS